MEAERYFDARDTVVVFTRARCIAKACGLPIDEEFADVMTMSEGRIVRYHAHRYRAEALEAAGLGE